MFILIMGVAQTKALVLDLTTPAASKRQKGRIATDPLLTTWRPHQRRRGIATETTMLAGNRLGFHPVVRHGVAFSGWWGCLRHPSRSLERCITPLIALSSALIFISTRDAPYRLRPWRVTSARDESTLESQKQSKSMETQSQAARRPRSIPAQTARSHHRRAGPRHSSTQRGPGAAASA